ncbi:hypothetical protein PR048_005498 [Dryococelus australis]|uniref:Uncharacterized protein n=1 Tax=Dryococelus australis TaxID=614101 RepID=A0ABQ9I8C5_9NEOP|nr:hypothetical protein PR048_005498 [Dryococelus australis]
MMPAGPQFEALASGPSGGVPRETRRPYSISEIFPTCDNPDLHPAGNEPGDGRTDWAAIFVHFAAYHAYHRKSLTIQHCIGAAARPRYFVSPIHNGLSIHLHRQLGSKLLIYILSNFTYRETLKYEASATLNSSTCIKKLTYAQYIFDNADYNIRTLNGYGSFHVMGGVQTVSPHSTLLNQNPVPRNIPATAMSAVGSLAYSPMVWYKHVRLEPESAQNTRLLEVLWAVVFTSDSSTVSKPSWNVPLPFINDDPNNQSIIYTALVYAAKESEKLQEKKYMLLMINHFVKRRLIFCWQYLLIVFCHALK